MKDVIHTPFGNFRVKQNGESVEFNCIIKNYSSNKSSSIIRLYVIEVEIKDKNTVCGFDNPIFEHQIKEEHSTTLFVENEELILGLCGITPPNQFISMTTNNEYGFTYNVENKITLMLCCVEKDKFNDAKTVIEKAFTSEIKLVKDIKTLPHKSHKTLITFALFGLLSLLYVAFAFLLIKYKVVTNEVLKKVGIGLVGVMMISYALSNLSTPKKKVKKPNTRITFLISFFLLSIILIALGITIYILLCSTKKVGNEMNLAIGITIISLVILCWFTSEYKIDKLDKKNATVVDEIETQEVKKEVPKIEEQPKKLNPIFLNLFKSFPKNLKEEWFSLARKLQIENIEVSELNTSYRLNRETVEIPYRIKLEEMEDINLTQIEKLMLYCIYTRHYDGHIREKYVKKILDIELQEWEYPYILKLSEEYVYEITELIYNNLKEQKNDELKEFARNNKELLCKGYSKMISYWNGFYRPRALNFHNYIGRKLFRDCFGYSRKYEKGKYRCACCGNNTIEGYLINYYNEPCPVCYWKNNVEQNNNSNKIGINKITLKEAKENYKNIGAIMEEYKSFARMPLEKEKVKINSDQTLKLLKLRLQEKGFTRKKASIPFYEYQNHYFRIYYKKKLFVIEKAETLDNVNNDIWETYKELSSNIEPKELVEQIVENILNICKKKQTKKKVKLTKTEKDKIVAEEIHNWDPLKLIKNDIPNEEYRIEIKQITTKLSKLKTEKELKEHIEQVFQKIFEENKFKDSKNEVSKVTKIIWKRINQK